MITRRLAGERGHHDHGWLEARHSFSFGDYHDAAHMGFRTLRVINDDIIQAGQGFGTHPHRDMEIVTYVIEGALEHRDNLGSGSVLRPGDVQRMTAGRGITHSEFNHDENAPLRLLQIWILPAEPGLEPGYEEKHFPPAARSGYLQLLVSPDGADGSLTIHQDVRLFAAILKAGDTVSLTLAQGRHAWIQIATGNAAVNGVTMAAGDGAAVSDEEQIVIEGHETAEILLFDLA